MARILIIEDNPANIELMSFLLSAYGHTPLTAPDGARGVAVARSERPDLVACDVNLPGMNGFAVLSALRAEPELAQMPVLAVTALAMAGDREQVLAAGFDGYISKPIEPESFVAELEAFLPAAQAAVAPGVLLVDDDGFMLGVLADMLAGQDYRVLSAASGAEALAVLEREPVAVVLADQAMPGMTGTALLAEVARRHPSTVRLILSGQTDLAEIEAATAAGIVDAHHAKPVSTASLRGYVEDALRLQRRRSGAAA
ncbi:response regulator [Massilia sp. KIM]|uniref:response regulator n=1 Tax=Massilia sp. KIM TaxID=1955422 RepID=UPI00098F1107|nr:response regulator [Massilia sp. KIM]OON63602.1 response regulator [Massilia sp. KIM]